MNNYLIKTENISKRYPIKKQSDKPDTLVGTILDFAYKCKCKKFLLISSGSCYGNVPE